MEAEGATPFFKTLETPNPEQNPSSAGARNQKKYQELLHGLRFIKVMTALTGEVIL